MQFVSTRARAARRILVVAALVAPLAAWAGAGTLTATVAPLSANVTYGMPDAVPPLNTFVGYAVSIRNDGGNTINNVSITGTSTVTDTALTAPIASVQGTNQCSFAVGGTTVTCTIGQLKAGEAVPTFYVFLRAPARPAVITAPNDVVFAGRTLYAETTGGANSVPPNSIMDFSTTVALGTTNPTLVKSAVPRSASKQSFYTGSGGVSLGSDPFATTATIPENSAVTTATINETGATVASDAECVNKFSTCFTSELTIGGTFSPYLTIVLRQDASTILKGTQIGSVLIRYTNSSGSVLVGDCASPTTPAPGGRPCIAKRTHYKNKAVPGWTPDLDGDFEWILINTENGSYKIF